MVVLGCVDCVVFSASVERTWLRFRGMFTSTPPVPSTAGPSTTATTATAVSVLTEPVAMTSTAQPAGQRKWWVSSHKSSNTRTEHMPVQPSCAHSLLCGAVRMCPFTTQNPIRWTAYLARQADRYGLALLIGYRVAGAVIILALYYTLEWGVPVRRLEELASYFGYSTDGRLVGTATQYAGAIVCSAALFPFTLMLAPFLARALHKVTSVVLGRGKSGAMTSTSTAVQQKMPPH